MSRSETKADLQFYLCDQDIRVVALKGLWGTGKTHLWDEVKTTVNKPGKQDHVYASCFGLENIEQLKMALFQNSLGKADEALSKLKSVGKGLSAAIDKAVTTFIPGGDGLTSIAGGLGGLLQSTLIERTLKDRLIVLDDIERRGKSLEAEAILGFIDFLKRNNCRILLILNEEPMEMDLPDEWRILKEKCIDRELTLLTSPRDAAAIGLSPDVISREMVIETLEKIGVSNIRVIQRIDRVLNAVFGEKKQVHEAVAKAYVPAIVIFTALNFNAIRNGPSLLALMKVWASWSANPSFLGLEDKNVGDDVTFGISHGLTRDMEFLSLLEKHITSGKRFPSEFKFFIEKRELSALHNDAENAAVRYVDSTLIDPKMTDQDFFAIATNYKNKWGDISADKISAIAKDLESRGNPSLANEIIQPWIVKARQSAQPWLSHFYSPDHFHPAIRDTVAEINKELLSKKPPLIKAVIQVSSKGWGHDDTAAINEATIDEIESALVDLDRENFGIFVHFYTSELKNPLKDQHGEMFSKGAKTCLAGVRKIVSENKHPSLARLLKLHFGDLLLPHETTPYPSQQQNLNDTP